MRQQTRRVLQGVAFCVLFVGVAVFMRVFFQWKDYNTTLREYIGNPSLVSQEGTETDEKVINPSIEMATTLTADVTTLTSPGEVTKSKPPVSATTKSQKPLIVDSTSSAPTLSIIDYSSSTPMVSTPSLKQKSDSLKVPASSTSDKSEKQPTVSKERVNDRLDTEDEKATALRQDSVKSVDQVKTVKGDTVRKPLKPGPVSVQPEQKTIIQKSTKDEQVKPTVVQKPAKGDRRQPAARQTPVNAATTKKRAPTTRKGPRDLSTQRQTRSPTTPVPSPSHFGVIFDEFHPHFQFHDDNIHMVADPSSTRGKAGDYDVLERDYFRYLARIQFDCRRREPAGKVDYIDDSWELCQDPPYDLVKDKCLVYSFE
ncbi:proteoglycan 4-like [Lingula anatina]|uniref:Proteoglycan 4-like n=1 Tax=Lingula anatina TaxID=7574 RepID=A0A1S3IG44_LINAN|nr:proteoglycan 4-like [Lingula anatina]|eukprot:XP_013396836.1 proteoglycan 4-like [Lingula anatina]